MIEIKIKTIRGIKTKLNNRNVFIHNEIMIRYMVLVTYTRSNSKYNDTEFDPVIS